MYTSDVKSGDSVLSPDSLETHCAAESFYNIYYNKTTKCILNLTKNKSDQSFTNKSTCHPNDFKCHVTTLWYMESRVHINIDSIYEQSSSGSIRSVQILTHMLDVLVLVLTSLS